MFMGKYCNKTQNTARLPDTVFFYILISTLIPFPRRFLAFSVRLHCHTLIELLYTAGTAFMNL